MAQAVVQRVVVALVHVDVHLSDGPFPCCHRRNVAYLLESQQSLAGHAHGVGQIGGVGWLVIEIAIVAEQVAYARPFAVESRHVERVAIVYLSLRRGACQQAVGRFGEAYVSQGVDGEQWSRLHVVSYLRLLGVALFQHLVFHVAAEISVRLQHELRHLGAQPRVHPRHEHWVGAKALEHPSRESVVLAGELVPYPQANREGRAYARPEYRAVGRRGKGGVNILLGRGEVAVFLSVT